MAPQPPPEPESGRFHVDGQALTAARPEPGLYLVATPIGNLEDITLRALKVLAAADRIACEDTRVTRKLLARYGIRTQLTAYHEHNAAREAPKLARRIAEGARIALVSDAGTPLISDPGYRLVRATLEEGGKVVPVPGPAAPVAALAGSGLPTDAFHFAGFLPVKKTQRDRRIEDLGRIDATLVLFESPRRLVATLRAIGELLGEDRDCVVARELTKAFETFHRGTAASLAEAFEAEPPRGEIVLLVAPPQAAEAASDDVVKRRLIEALAEMPPSKAAARIAKDTGRDKSEVYRLAMELKASGDEDADEDRDGGG